MTVGTEKLNKTPPAVPPKPRSSAVYAVEFSTQQCAKLSKSHATAECPEFRALTTKRRWDLAKRAKLCSCCLEHGHLARECQKLERSHCGERHHSLRHYSKSVQPQQAAAQNPATMRSAAPAPRQESSHHASVSVPQTTAFATVPVKIIGPTGKSAICTAMLDSGSTVNFIREDVAHELDMAGEVHMLTTSMIGAQQTSSYRELVKVQMESIDGTVSYPLKDAYMTV